MTYKPPLQLEPGTPKYRSPTVPVNSTDAGPYPSRFLTLPIPLEESWTPNEGYNVLEEEMRPDNRDEMCFDGAAGDSILDGRYQLVRKVNNTQEISTWLASDHKKNRYVHIEIFGTRVSQSDFLLIIRGLKLFERSERNDEPPMSSHRIIRYEDDFTIASKHGLHRCLLGEPLCGDISVIRMLFPKEQLPMMLCKRLAKDVLLGLRYLHRELGVVYTGLHLDSTLLKGPDIEGIIAIETSLHPPIIYHVTYPGTEHEGRFQSQTQPLPPWSGRVEDADLTAIRGVLELNKVCVQDIHACINKGPEVLLGYEWTTKTDVWGFACLVYQMICKYDLFTLGPVGGEEEEYFLTEVTEILGSSYPERMIEQSPVRHKYFDDNNELRFKSTAEGELGSDTLESFVENSNNKELSAFEVSDLVRFLKRCLKLDPDDRATIDELLEDPWLFV